MGCSAIKAPDCCQLILTEDDRNLVSSLPADCYSEVTHPYNIKTDFFPIIDITPVNYTADYLVLDIFVKDFQVFSLTATDLLQYSFRLFEIFELNSGKLIHLLDLIKRNYNSIVPFHNFWHAFSVAQMLFVIGERNMHYKDFLTRNEYSYLLIIGMGHDLCHPGINNSFLTATRHEIAKKYNNISVLENFHSAVLISLIEKSSLFDDETLKNIKKIFIEGILSTDMANHKRNVTEFIEAMENYDAGNDVFRQRFINYILHSCDLGNQTLDFNIAVAWSLKITQEFNQQVASEELKGITISEYMRIGNSITNIKNLQCSFIDHAIMPMWIILTDRVPGIKDFIDTLIANKKKWKNLKSFQNLDLE